MRVSGIKSLSIIHGTFFLVAITFVSQLLRKGGTRLMEPFMKLEVIVEERFLHAVLGDFAQHRSDILEVNERHELKVRNF